LIDEKWNDMERNKFILCNENTKIESIVSSLVTRIETVLRVYSLMFSALPCLDNASTITRIELIGLRLGVIPSDKLLSVKGVSSLMQIQEAVNTHR